MAHIQIGDISPRIQYTANGSVTTFAFPFPIFEDSDLLVYLDGALQSSGYAVSGAGETAGGSAVFSVAPANGVIVTLGRSVPIARTTDFSDGGAFRAAVINEELDRLVCMAQQMREELGRTVQRPLTSTSTAALALPDPVPGRALKFGAGGALTLSAIDPDAAAIEAAASASAAAASANAAEAAADAAADEAATATAAALSANFATALASAQASQVAAQGSASSASVAAAAAAGSAVGAAASAAAAAASAIAAANATLVDPLILASALPCLDLRAVPDVVPPVLSATRASAATRINAKRIVDTAASNALRYDFDTLTGAARGWLVEGARTNLAINSAAVGATGWSLARCSAVANAAVAPDGTTTADKVVEDTSATTTHVAALGSYVPVAGDNHVYSIFLKRGERTSALIEIAGGGAATVSGVVDLATGAVVSGSVRVVNAGGGWWRCWVALTAVTTASIACRTYLRNATGHTYTGDGTSGIYAWGAQLEVGAYPSTYIPTAGTSASRGADLLEVPLSAVPGWNSAEGALYLDAEFSYSGAVAGVSQAVVCIDDGTSNNRIMVWLDPAGALRLTLNKAGVQTVNAALGAAPTGRFRLAASWSADDYSVAINGTASAHTPTASTVPVGLTTLNIGKRLASSDPFFGIVRGIALFPVAIGADVQLITGGL